MPELAAQLVEDSKTVGVDIASVVDSTARQPAGLAQRFESVAGTEDNHAVFV